MRLPAELEAQIIEHCKRGDALVAAGNVDTALLAYEQAFDLLPEPRETWKASTWVYIALGDAFWLAGEYDSAREALTRCLRCPEGAATPYPLLRLGQAEFELGETAAAREHLAAAVALGGVDVLVDEDPKYAALLAAKPSSES